MLDDFLKCEYWQGIGAIFTLLGFIIIWRQLLQDSKLNRANFENDLTKEFRIIMKEIPIDALLNDEIEVFKNTNYSKLYDKESYQKVLMSFYRYIDLSNEQVFLMMKNKISKEVWYEWQEGIKSNLKKKAFKQAFMLINEPNSKSFDELKYFIYRDGYIEFSDTFDSSYHYSCFERFKDPLYVKNITEINTQIKNMNYFL